MSYDMNDILYYLQQSGFDDSSIAALAAMNTVTGLLSFAIAVVSIVALWKLFTKSGEKGWKAIIPLYNQYIMYKLYWKRMWFWITLALAVVILVLSGILLWDTAVYTLGYTSIAENTFLTVVLGLTAGIMVLCIPLVVIEVIFYWKMAKSFNEGVGYFFGLLFLNVIFYCILAFGDAKYYGPEGKNAPAAATPQPYPVQPTQTYAPVSAGYQPQTYQPQNYQPQAYVPQTQSNYAPTATLQTAADGTRMVYNPETGTYIPVTTVAPAAAPETPVAPQDTPQA